MRRIIDDRLRANTYLLPTASEREVVVVDPGLNTEGIMAALSQENLVPAAIVCTHGHFDHVASAHDLQATFGAPLYLHRDDRRVLRSANFLMMACGMTRRITLPVVDHWVTDGTELDIAGRRLRFIHTPGHTPGSCLITCGETIFSGDCIYRHGIGGSGLPGSDTGQLRDSVLRVWDELPEQAWVYPGHGPAGRFGDIRRENRGLRRLLGLDEAQAA